MDVKQRKARCQLPFENGIQHNFPDCDIIINNRAFSLQNYILKTIVVSFIVYAKIETDV